MYYILRTSDGIVERSQDFDSYESAQQQVVRAIAFDIRWGVWAWYSIHVN